MDFLNKYLKFLGITQKEYRRIQKSKSIIFDQDGDRVFFSARGGIIRSDFIACLLAKDFLKRHKGAKIIIDSRSSKILSETIKKYGGKVLFSKVGHSFFKQAMAKHRAVLGAELSGHYYFKEFFNCDNGLLAAIKILGILKKKNLTIDQAVAPFKKYYQSGEISIKIKNQKAKSKILEKYFKDARKISHFDGLTIEYKDWWFNLRPSNTEPVIRLNIEAKSPEILKAKKFLLLKLLSKY